MLSLITSLILLAVLSLIVVVILHSIRVVSAQQREFTKLRDALRERAEIFSPGPLENKPERDGASGSLRITGQQIMQQLNDVLAELGQRQREYQVLTMQIGEKLDAVADKFSNQQASLDRLITTLNSRQPSALTVPIETIQRPPVAREDEFLPPRIETAPTPTPVTPQRLDVKTDSNVKSRFDNLGRWVMSNLQRLMQRSLSSRSQPEMLASDIPSELEASVEIVDGVVMLIGTRDCAEKFALVLPGSYIGARYYDWFEVPLGTNERVEDTTDPALVCQAGADFIVTRRGVVRQN